ncbi:MAG TPA: NB-ARC domain-containing protein [Acidimicrobiales bacterium]|nr:NB-ARC domain-containing protein [Acidimicrobiales bacterium]
MANQPAGTLTFVLTDIEGSTRQWQRDEGAMRSALERHDALLASCIEGADGRIFKHTGDGMCAAFPSAHAAVIAAAEVQRRLATPGVLGGEGADLRVRIGVHTGDADERDGDYFGPTLNRVARIMDAAHGGQVLVSSATAALLAGQLPDGTALRDLGEHRLRDIDVSEHLFQLTAPGLPGDFPALRVPDARTDNLPSSRSAFVGRSAEIGELVGHMTAGAVVTLIGIGGTGKTRLAVEVARHCLDRFDTAYFVDLSALADGSQILPAVAGACGLTTTQPAAPLWDTVTSLLAGRRTLLLLDNCEHLLDACAGLLEDLLEQCPDLCVLATSREALSVDGERTWPVGSLPTQESVELFVTRARAADADFPTDAATTATVTEICEQLDGIPLALELAAARVGHLSAAELAAHLDDRFRLLTGGRRRRTQRQQTLRAAIDWSFDLLQEHERVLFRRLSVFSGGFTLPAAAAVCGGGDDTVTLDTLGSLVAKSLVVRERPPAPSTSTRHPAAGGSPITRYRMLETIRLYAADRLLEAGEVDRLRDAHFDYWLTTARRSPFDERALRWDLGHELAADVGNVRAALDWYDATGRSDRALELAVSSGALWHVVEFQDEGADRLTRLLQDEAVTDDQRALALALLSSIHMARGEFPDMARCARRSLALRPEGPGAGLASVFAALYLSFTPDRYPEAHALFDDARRLAEQHHQPWAAQLATGIEAHFWLVEGDVERPVEAARAITSSQNFADMNARLAAAVALVLRGELDEAMAHVEQLAANWGDEWAASHRATVLAEEGRADEARRTLVEASGLYLDQPYPLIASDFLIAVAAIEHGRDPALAAELLACTVSERDLASFRSPAAFVLWKRYRALVKAELDADTWNASKARGAQMTTADTVRREVDRLRAALAEPD